MIKARPSLHSPWLVAVTVVNHKQQAADGHGSHSPAPEGLAFSLEMGFLLHCLLIYQVALMGTQFTNNDLFSTYFG